MSAFQNVAGALVSASTVIFLSAASGVRAEEPSVLERLQTAPQIGEGERFIRFSPYLQLDGAFSETSPDTLRPAGEGREGEIRRARFYTDFQYDAFGGRLSLDFAEWRDAPFDDTYLNYALSDATTLQVGQQDIPFSLQALTGSRSALFAEDGANEIFGLDDATGVAAWSGGDDWSLAAGVYGGNINEQPFDDGVLFAARATRAPDLGEDAKLHLGLGLAAGFDRQEALTFEGRVGTDLSTVVPITTDSFDGPAETLAANAEVGAIYGRLTLQGEYTLFHVDSHQDGSALLHGGYAGALVFLTDDRRNYDATTGTFEQVAPARPFGEGGWGALEIGARLEGLNLSDAADAGATLAGTAVANWYPTDILRLTASHTLTEVTSGPDDGDRIDTTLLRLAIIY